ncbi:MAG TPA: hypothetical protein VJP78_12475 [Thermoleophilia bacterium]|nr:hypothetical protein [Thermoleophilia bacterium]
MTRESIRAVHDDDLDAVLDRLGLGGKLRAGDLKCRICGEIVTRETLQALFPDSGTIKVLCNKPSCMTGLIRGRED